MNRPEEDLESARLLSNPISCINASPTTQPFSALREGEIETPRAIFGSEETLRSAERLSLEAEPTSRSSSDPQSITEFTFDEHRPIDLELRTLSSPPSGESCTRASPSAGTSGKFPVERRSWTTNELTDWRWESAACISSLVAFAATVGLLKAFDGKSQPDWPYGIMLNSAISILTTMMKGFLLVPAAACISQSIWISYTMKSQRLDILAVYDAASRGPLGAVRLLWVFRVNYDQYCVISESNLFEM